MYKKGILKARILQGIYLSDSPATISWLEGATGYPLSSVKDCVARLVVERCIERRKIKWDGMEPTDFKLYPLGRSPMFYYMIRDRGLQKLRYYADIGLIEL